MGKMLLALKIVLIITSFVLIAGVLLQSGKSAGLSGSIDGGASTFFGKKKGYDELFSKLTTVAAVVFMVLAVVVAALG